jgi:hypothetical protein
MNKMLLQLKLKTRRFKLIRIFHSAQKEKFEGLQTEICVGIEGCPGHPQAYGLGHP